MALSTRETAIAALAAVLAWTLLAEWSPLFRWAGYGFLAGAITVSFGLLALLILSVQRLDQFRHIEDDSAPLNVAFVAPSAWKEHTDWLKSQTPSTKQAIVPSSFVLSEAVDAVLALAVGNFVTSWYGHISTSGRFEAEIDRAVRGALIVIGNRLANLDAVEVGVSRFAPLITTHLRDFDEAERAVRGRNLERAVTESEELDMAIAARYRNGRLHPAVSLATADPRFVQQEYLRKLVIRLLPEILPPEILQSGVVMVLIREIMACVVFGELMRILADPDTWNRVLEAYGRTVLQDRRTVRKLRAALDEHASPAPKTSIARAFPSLGLHDDERRFERFIRAIRQCDNLSDARRFRSEVSSQLRREFMIEGQDAIYIRRLETGRRALDHRVGKLSAVGGSGERKSKRFGVNGHHQSRFAHTTLQDILRDATGLSYFMEYMDRQRLMPLLQFWLVVDGFRNPLEDDLLDGDSVSNAHSEWKGSDRMDIAQIAEAYLSKAELKVPESSRTDVKTFLRAGSEADTLQYAKARSAILKAQTTVLHDLQENHFPGFQSSDLFYKLLTSEESNAQSRLSPKTARHPSILSMVESTDHSQSSSRLMSRVNSGVALIRNANSSSDLRGPAKLTDGRPRRSFDVSSPLFDDDITQERMTGSIGSLDTDPLGTNNQGNEDHMVEAMEAALNTIMTDRPQEDDGREPLFGDSDIIFAKGNSTVPSDAKKQKSESEKPRERPNLASLGLVNTSSRIGVFTDNDLFGDEEKFIEDERADSEEFANEQVEDEIHQAAPGDLGLAEAISVLTIDIDRLIAQESVVDALTRKAELTDNLAELRILGKSKSSLQREVRRKELQRQQYIIQESDNSLYGRANVEIKQIMVGKEADGQEFALYVIEVQRRAGEHMSAASWAVARRYSEFHDLHQRLRQLYPAVRNLDFPRRRLVMKLQRDFLHRRRVSLEQYLRALLHLPAVCQSRDLRAFLSQQAIISESSETSGQSNERADIVSRIYNSVTDGMDEFLGNIPVLDQLSLAGQNLISAATSQYASLPFPSSSNDAIDSLVSSTISVSASAEAQAEVEAYDKSHDLDEPFVKPICDLFLEIFELNRSANWLRGRAVVVVLHQLLGGTVERKIRDAAHTLASPTHLLRYLDLAREAVWPGGAGGGASSTDRSPAGAARSDAQRKASRQEAGLVLAALVPDVAGNVVGRANAAAAARRLAAAGNHQRLNAHLAFELLDEVVAALFPEVAGRGGRGSG